MEEIRAFVGHSFDQDDAAVVNCYLKYFDQLANLHPRFSWGHAEAAEPMVVAEKVMSLIANKNVFIGICTKKERVIQQGPLQKSFFHPRRFVVGEDQCYWKTSDWIIQEIGLAKGRNLEIILLIEAGVRVPGGLQSDLEYIPFDRNAPEKSFGKILEMITALSPRSSRPAAIATSTQAAPADEQNTLDPSEDTDWEIPKPEWTRRRYEVAFWLMSKEGNEASAETIHRAYLTTEDALQDDNKTVWEAYCEYTRLSSGKGESFAQLKELAAAYPNSSGVLRYLALGFEKYQDYAKSAPTYEAAAMEAQNEIERLRLLKNAAKAHARTGAAGATAKVIDQMKVQVQTSGVGEEELLQALKEVAEVRNEDEALLGIMERMVYLDPSDTKTRFSLAYKYSEVGNNDLALFHYLRIPYNERDPVTWNNLGVAFDQFSLAAKSVYAYRKAEKAGETLAMSNLAQKFITAGFLPEAQEQCDTALKTENYHNNIPHTIARLKNLPNEEEKKEVELVEKAKTISDFYTAYGRALSRTEVSGLAKRWKGPSCDLDATVQDSIFEAEGSYELQQSSLIGALLGESSGFGLVGKTPPVRYHVKYYGSIRGYGIEGIVIRGREDEQQQLPPLSSTNDNESRVLMIVSDDSNEIRVMEGKQGTSPKFYTLSST